MDPAADAVVDLYRRHAAAWTKARGDRLVERTWLDRFLAVLDPEADVLDVGCGSGLPIARYLAQRGHRVTGIDSSPEMIALFRRNLPEGQAETGDMRTLRLGRRFGGLIAWNSFFHLDPDTQRAMFDIFAAHAGPGAALTFTSGPKQGVAMGLLEGEPLYHASLAPGEYRALLDTHDFDLLASKLEDPDCAGHSVWLAQRR